jgi:hypothetical protein
LKFKEWKDELSVLVRDEMDLNLSEIEDLDEEVMRNYCREGYSPKEFYKDQVTSFSDSSSDDFVPFHEL